MKLVPNTFKSGGLHEKHVVATWNIGNHLSICLTRHQNFAALFQPATVTILMFSSIIACYIYQKDERPYPGNILDSVYISLLLPHKKTVCL